MLEVLAVLVVLFFIAVLFYKQANESFEVLQLEANRMDELPTLYADHAPIVIRSYQTPPLGTQQELEKRPQIMQMAVAPSLSLKALLGSTGSLKEYTWKLETTTFLAKETGLETWFNMHLLHSVTPSQYTRWMYSSRCSLWPHHRGLFKTTAFQTVLMPTQGDASVNLLLSKSEPYLPRPWTGRQFAKLTPADTPLLNQIQCIEVKLRKGTLLLLPAHMIVDIASSDDTNPVWTMVAEVHHPISRLAS
jgi:hypothetical protein